MLTAVMLLVVGAGARSALAGRRRRPISPRAWVRMCVRTGACVRVSLASVCAFTPDWFILLIIIIRCAAVRVVVCVVVCAVGCVADGSQTLCASAVRCVVGCVVGCAVGCVVGCVAVLSADGSVARMGACTVGSRQPGQSAADGLGSRQRQRSACAWAAVGSRQRGQSAAVSGRPVRGQQTAAAGRGARRLAMACGWARTLSPGARRHRRRRQG